MTFDWTMWCKVVERYDKNTTFQFKILPSKLMLEL